MKKIATEETAHFKKEADKRVEDAEDKAKKETQSRISALEQIKQFSQDYQLFREQQLDELADKMRDAGLAEVDIERWKLEELKKLQRESWEFRLENATSASEAIGAKLKLMSLDVKSYFEHMADVIEDTFSSLEGTLSDVFFDAFKGKMKSLSDYVNSFLNSILQSMSQVMGAMATKGIMGAIGNAITPGTESSPYFDQPGGAEGPANMPWYKRHGGGYIPKFHGGGLNSDERHVIAKVGERFITSEQNEWLTRQAAGGSAPVVNIKLENQSSQALNMETTGVKFDRVIGAIAVTAVIKDYQGNGPMRSLIRGGS